MTLKVDTRDTEKIIIMHHEPTLNFNLSRQKEKRKNKEHITQRIKGGHSVDKQHMGATTKDSPGQSWLVTVSK